MALQDPSGKGGGRRLDPIEPPMSSPSGSSPASPNDANAPCAEKVLLRLRRGRVVRVSDRIRDLLGWCPEEWIGHGVEDFLHPEGLGGVDVRLAQLGPGQRVIWRDRLRSRDGRWHWVQLEVTPVGVGDGDGDGVEAVARLMLMTEGADPLPEDLGHELHCDDLTDLLNRREVLRRLERLQGEERRQGKGMAVLFCDLDDFKAINDRWGHCCGDVVLRQVAQRLRQHLRSTDLAARIGGDELLVVLDGVRGLDDALSLAHALRLAVAQPLELPDGRGFTVPTLSIGVTLARPHELTAELIERADAAMDRAKRNGRNQVVAIAA
jgi:diguanylate cyclase (GGDEF)-like protein/PAS domain S-box-containing protein